MLAPWPKKPGSISRRLKLAAGPTAEAVSGDLVKAAWKVNVDTNAFGVQQRIATARNLSEQLIRRCLVQQIWDMFLDDEAYVDSQPSFMPWYTSGVYGPSYGMAEIVLPLPPVRQVIGVYTTDQNGLETVVNPNIYAVSKSQEPCRIRLQAGQSWPYHRGFESFRVRFAAGYATPVTFAADGMTLQASNHGIANGDYISFTSHDGTLPDPLSINTNYFITNLTATTLQLTDLAGNLINGINPQWSGTAFIGEIPSPIARALVMISGLDQASEIPSRFQGVGAKTAPIEIPIEPAELLAPYIWPQF